MTRKKRKTKGDEEDYFSFAEGEPEREPPPRVREPPPTPQKGWPDEIPVLTADDMLTNYSNLKGQRDLLEWLEATFEAGSYTGPTPKRDKANRVLLKVVNEWAGDRRWSCLWMFLEYAHKHKKPSLAWQAAAWNEAMSRLGYEVPERSRRKPQE